METSFGADSFKDIIHFEETKDEKHFYSNSICWSVFVPSLERISFIEY